MPSAHTPPDKQGLERLWLSAVACRNMMPDPAFYADCLRASFDELVAAGEALPERAPAKTSAGRRPPKVATAARGRGKPAARAPRAAAPPPKESEGA